MKMERIWVGWLLWAAMVVAELQGSSGCLEKERIGLMKLLKAVKQNDLALRPSDCCSWIGVDCSAATGRVENLTVFSNDRILLESPGYFLNASLFLPFEELLELDLFLPGIDGLANQADLTKFAEVAEAEHARKQSDKYCSLQAFANMKNLKYLDLSENYVNISSVEGICDMKNIIELRLGWNNIRGDLPLCIGNLTRLQILDIGYNQIGGNIPSTIGNLSRLSSLYLQGNYFSGAFSLHSLANNSKLEDLHLSSHHNRFHLETETQSWVPQFQLQSLELRNSNLNKMSGSVSPTFLLNQSELVIVDLSFNKLQDTFPSWLLQNNSNLKSLWMKGNFLTGNLVLPNFIHGLTEFDISYNKIDGKLPHNLQVFLPALEHLDFSFNSFTGKLPKTLFANNTDLLYMDFSNNLLYSEISLNLIAHPSLIFLILSNNKFNGSLEELPSRSLSQLQFFDISNNLISGILPNSIADFSFLQFVKVSNNSLEGEIPDKLCLINKLNYLDISHNNFSGSMPSCLGNLSIRALYMRNCGLTGNIPDGLLMNSKLAALDLSYNDFSHSILPNLIYSLHQLRVLLVAGLHLEGDISTQLCGLEKIKIMDLSHNNFNGSIPSCLFKMPFWVAETQDNYIDDSSALRTYLLFDVEFTTKGRLNRFEGNILNHMSGLDVSSNKLSGQIPSQIGDSEAIHALNLSNNRLWGPIPSSISRLRAIESLDLSSNNLSGEIPSEIVLLNFISYFNICNNNLSGPIPNGGQFSNFDEQNYGGNKFLCGPLLHRVCTNEQDNEETSSDDETIFERTFFWWSFGASYVIVIISMFVLFGINTHYSRVWLHTVGVLC